ncbi:hypothetical protein [Ralstonia pseudosolanacearum]|nr:hypothetical protein [Ralstonia pseudosolanacearum]QWQ14049.1 hypothetical protein KN198_24325 [Ralstonia solanacearum]
MTKGISGIARRVPTNKKLRPSAFISDSMKKLLVLGKILGNPIKHVMQPFTIDLN